ncbi:MAG: hypothetical protein U0470_02985 [Anaerolineae bacterium]
MSLCYENATCTLEEDSATDDVIGGPYRPDRRGVGGTQEASTICWTDPVRLDSTRRRPGAAGGSVRQQR